MAVLKEIGQTINHLDSALFTKIQKRDGRLVRFEAHKITNAIKKAGEVTGEFADAEAKRLMIRVLNLSHALFGSSNPAVEEIQDIVEEVLLSSPYKKTAKAYIIYREQHTRIRNITKKADLKLIDSYLENIDWKVRENSNMAYSLQGLNNYISSEISKSYWLNKIYSSEIRKAHETGELHIHDLGQLSVYCVGWDLQDLLRSGFKGAYGKAESSPAKHFSSILGQIVNFFIHCKEKRLAHRRFQILIPFYLLLFDMEVYSRVVGYLRPVKQWNEGKQAEFSMRSRFKIES